MGGRGAEVSTLFYKEAKSELLLLFYFFFFFFFFFFFLGGGGGGVGRRGAGVRGFFFTKNPN